MRCALAIVDEGGLAALNMRELAGRMGVYPTALYWHVKNKSVLLSEIAALVMRDRTPMEPDLHWRSWIRLLFQHYREAIRQHPNVATLIGAQLVTNCVPNLVLVESTLHTLRRAGFDDRNIVQAYNTVIAAMVGFTTIEFAELTPDPSDVRAAALRQYLDESLSPEYPTIAKHREALENKSFILRSDNGTKVALDSSFDFYVETVVAGLEVLLAQPR